MLGNPAGAFGFRRLPIDGPLLEPLTRSVSEKQIAQRSILATEGQVEHARCARGPAGGVRWEVRGLLARFPAKVIGDSLPTSQRVRVAEGAVFGCQVATTEQQIERGQHRGFS
ncbi:hypothetical protein D3C86_1404580 [compost metagenome]